MIQTFLFAHFLSNENGALRNAKMELKFESDWRSTKNYRRWWKAREPTWPTPLINAFQICEIRWNQRRDHTVKNKWASKKNTQKAKQQDYELKPLVAANEGGSNGGEITKIRTRNSGLRVKLAITELDSERLNLKI